VSSAQVNLVLPSSQDQLFSDQNQAATASVLLSGSNDLQQGSVRGIAQLVASSVPGLTLGKVTITGADGSLLWPSSSSASSGGLPTKEADEQRYDSLETAQVNAMLAQTLGAGKAQVIVNANLDANRATSDSLVYGNKKTSVPATRQTTQETLKGAGAGAGAGGAAGTSSNLPAYSSTSGSGSGNSNYKDTTSNTDFDVDKTVTHSVIAPGAIQQQSVSVLVDKSVPASEIPAIRSAVANAVGLNTKRGDQLSVSQLAFAPVKTTATKVATAGPLQKYGRYGALGLGCLLFLGFTGRMLRRREREPFGEPTWLTELEAPRTLASLEARSAPTEVAALQPHVAVARRQVEDLVHRDPDRVAQHLRAWMAED
jgi:flagellar M-ring protein FliF